MNPTVLAAASSEAVDPGFAVLVPVVEDLVEGEVEPSILACPGCLGWRLGAEAGGLVLVPVRSPVRRCPDRPAGCAVVVVAQCHQSLVVLGVLSVPTVCAMVSHLSAVRCWRLWMEWTVLPSPRRLPVQMRSWEV